MADPFEQVIRELEAEKAVIEQAIAVLQQRAPGSRNDTQQTSLLETSAEPSGPLTGATNEKAIDYVLEHYPDSTTREIVTKAESFGKKLNINGIRWTLHHGVESGKWEKRMDGRVNRFSIIGK